jgi:hypothetical protein
MSSEPRWPLIRPTKVDIGRTAPEEHRLRALQAQHYLPEKANSHNAMQGRFCHPCLFAKIPLPFSGKM